MSKLILLVLFSLNIAAVIKGSAEFLAKANPGFLEIQGVGAQVTSDDFLIKDHKISGTFKTKGNEFDTGLDTRNKHMRENYLETGKFPDIIFLLDPVLWAAGTKKAFSGKLTLHGKVKPVTGLVEFSATNAIASFTVDVTDYGITVPTYRLLTVGKNVDVKVTIPL